MSTWLQGIVGLTVIAALYVAGGPAIGAATVVLVLVASVIFSLRPDVAKADDTGGGGGTPPSRRYDGTERRRRSLVAGAAGAVEDDASTDAQVRVDGRASGVVADELRVPLLASDVASAETPLDVDLFAQRLSRGREADPRTYHTRARDSLQLAARRELTRLDPSVRVRACAAAPAAP